MLYLDWARALGLKVIWTVHNLTSHEHRYPRLEAWFWKAFLRRVNGYISLSETGREVALERFPQLRDVPGSVVLLGRFRGHIAMKSAVSRRAKRSDLRRTPGSCCSSARSDHAKSAAG